MDPSRHIRSAQPADAAALLAIYEPVVRDVGTCFELQAPSEMEFAARIERVTATDPWLVLEQSGEIAGYAYAAEFRSRPAYSTTRETTVYVHADHHRAGVGRKLMTALLAEMRERGARLAIAVIALPNDASVALHEGLGFAHIGTIHSVARKFDTWYDEGIWELDLGSP